MPTIIRSFNIYARHLSLNIKHSWQRWLTLPFVL